MEERHVSTRGSGPWEAERLKAGSTVVCAAWSPGGCCPQSFTSRKSALGCEHEHQTSTSSATNSPFTTSWTPSGAVPLVLPWNSRSQNHRKSSWPQCDGLLPFDGQNFKEPPEGC